MRKLAPVARWTVRQLTAAPAAPVRGNRRQEHATRGEPLAMVQTFIVAGSDGIAVRLAEELAALGERAVVLAHDMEPRFRTRLGELSVQVLEGDPRDVADLRRAGLEQAAAVAIVEDNDVANLHSALAARGARPEVRLVTREPR